MNRHNSNFNHARHFKSLQMKSFLSVSIPYCCRFHPIINLTFNIDHYVQLINVGLTKKCIILNTMYDQMYCIRFKRITRGLHL